MPAQTPTAAIRTVEPFRLLDAVRLVLPKEHGSWSLALEPVALGLLVAPSSAGIPLALAAGTGLFLRRPVKILLQAKPDPRRALAAFCAGMLMFVAATGLLLTVKLGGSAQLWPLIPAALAGLFFIWFDARSENRAGAAEIAGAGAFALLPATFATLAGWPVANSLALAAVMLARSVPTVMVVRIFLRHRKGAMTSSGPALLATLAAAGMLFWLASLSLVPWLVAAFFILLLARAAWFLSAQSSRLTARRLGFVELFLGVTMLLTAASAWS
jgi:hypothetical protein